MKWYVLAAVALAAIAVAAIALWPRDEPLPPNVIRAEPALVEANALLQRDPIAARVKLREVVRARPRHAAAWAQLAAAELAAGDPIAARMASMRSLELVAVSPETFTEAERLLVEARRAEIAGDRPAATAAWDALDKLAPSTSASFTRASY